MLWQGPAGYWKCLQIPAISLAYRTPSSDPVVTRMEGSFSYPGSNKGAKHSPGDAGVLKFLKQLAGYSWPGKLEELVGTP